MRQWQRAPLAALCGGCDALVQPGEPWLLIELPGVTKQRRRCQACAGEPVDWEALAVPQEAVAKLPAFRPVADMAEVFDARKAQAGKDD